MRFPRHYTPLPTRQSPPTLSRLCAAMVLASCVLAPSARADSLQQDFETGLAGWFADNGVWEVGTPTGAPGCHGGAQCAGTVLDGNYPFTNSRLVSTPVQLDRVAAGQFLSLRFWHWFAWGSATGGAPGQGYVQVSTYDQVSGWSPWVNASSAYQGTSAAWTAAQVDLTPHAGKLVRIGFLHLGANSFNTGPGWFVDDIVVPGVACTTGVELGYEAGTLSIAITNGTTEAGTWNLALASRNKLSKLRSQQIDITDPPAQTSVTIPGFRPAGEVGVLSSINIPGKGIACSTWRTLQTSPTP